jgi:hypothetical protein
MQEIVAELQQLGALDKAAQDKLMEDLRQTDPSLWPLVLQQFRATVAYRRQAQQRERGAAAGGAPPAATPAFPSQPVPEAVAQRSGVSGSPAGSVPSRAAPTLPGAPYATQSDQRSEPGVDRLPAANDATLPPSAAPPGSYPRTPYPASDLRVANRPAGDRQGGATSGRVVSVSYDPVVSGDWRAQLAPAVAALEAETAAPPKTPDDVAKLAQLKMLYLLAGRREAAMQPLPTVEPAMQEFWTKELYGLATWLDTQRNPDAAGRAAEAKRALDEALSRLGDSAPLVVRNLAFCSEVQSYGCAKQFKANDFLPEQELLLYAEVENFASEPTPKGFHTALQSSYQIFDSRGQRVADHDFTVTEEYCQNPRRDFFIGYHLRLPKRIYPGKHTLQLTIADQKSKKVGQSSIEFSVKDAPR